MQEENQNNEEKKSIDSEVKPEANEPNEPEAKKEEPKTGIEKLKAIGLKEVSNKTFINLENLTYLLDKDFEKLHKTKALGFIQILERDFDVDLADLKDDYLDFQSGGRRRSKKKETTKTQNTKETHRTQKPTPNHIKKPQPAKRSQPKPIANDESSFKIGPYLLILLAALLGYYLFSGATEDDNKLEVLDLNVVQNDTITKKAQENLLATAIEENSTNSTLEDDDIDLNKVVHEMFKEADLNESELSKSENIDNDTNLTTATKTAEDVDKNETNTQEKEEKEAKNEKIIDTQSPNTQEKEEPKEILKPKPTPKVEKPKTTVTNNLYIKPTKKAWVGVIYLDNFSKKDYLIRGKLNLDPNRDQIILIGHKNFKIYNDGEEEHFNSKKMVRFIYEGGVLREISKKEYLNRSAGTRW